MLFYTLPTYFLLGSVLGYMAAKIAVLYSQELLAAWHGGMRHYLTLLFCIRKDSYWPIHLKIVEKYLHCNEVILTKAYRL